MHRSFTPLIVTVLAGITLKIAGCSDPGASKLTGRWDLDSAKPLSSIDDSDGQGRMTIIFHRNGKLETITDFAMAEAHKEGRWSLVAYEPSESRAVVICYLNKEQIETEIKFEGNDKIKLIPPNIASTGKRLVFRRNTEK